MPQLSILVFASLLAGCAKLQNRLPPSREKRNEGFRETRGYLNLAAVARIRLLHGGKITEMTDLYGEPASVKKLPDSENTAYTWGVKTISTDTKYGTLKETDTKYAVTNKEGQIIGLTIVHEWLPPVDGLNKLNPTLMSAYPIRYTCNIQGWVPEFLFDNEITRAMQKIEDLEAKNAARPLQEKIARENAFMARMDKRKRTEVWADLLEIARLREQLAEAGRKKAIEIYTRDAAIEKLDVAR